MSRPAPLGPCFQRKALLCVLRVYREPNLFWFYCPRCEHAHEGFASDPRGRQGICCASCGEQFSIGTRALIKNG